jgi:N,N'-diacetyllegionaminate synthase
MQDSKDTNNTYIIAEIGPNHNGDINLALKMVDQLAQIGIDAIKFQLAIPENLYSKDAFKAEYQKRNDLSDDLMEAARKRQLSREDHRTLRDMCESKGIQYLCTAFDTDSLRFLDLELNVPIFKIPSGEIASVDILGYIATRPKPIIMSTGMATYTEIHEALQILDPERVKAITILHCVSQYPALAAKVNLRNMVEIRRRFSYPIGYSDHTEGNEAAIAAVALGASVIEKHVTLDRNLPGPDHRASATIDQFRSLVESIRIVEKTLGHTDRIVTEEDEIMAKVARKSIVSRRNLNPGELISEDDVCFKRPGTGFRPTELDSILGRRVSQPIGADRVIHPEELE